MGNRSSDHFLREHELKLDEEDFNILHKAKITGQSFLMMTENKFIKARIAFGPPIILAKEVASFKNRTKDHFHRTVP